MIPPAETTQVKQEPDGDDRMSGRAARDHHNLLTGHSIRPDHRAIGDNRPATVEGDDRSPLKYVVKRKTIKTEPLSTRDGHRRATKARVTHPLNKDSPPDTARRPVVKRNKEPQLTGELPPLHDAVEVVVPRDNRPHETWNVISEPTAMPVVTEPAVLPTSGLTEAALRADDTSTPTPAAELPTAAVVVKTEPVIVTERPDTPDYSLPKKGNDPRLQRGQSGVDNMDIIGSIYQLHVQVSDDEVTAVSVLSLPSTSSILPPIVCVLLITHHYICICIYL